MPKIGALAKAELTPIWSVTDTKWGAISKGGDQWIFLGDPKLVDTTLEVASTPHLPPSDNARSCTRPASFLPVG